MKPFVPGENATTDSPTPYVYLNGEMLPADRAVVSAMDHGLLFGLGLFETLRAYGGKPFRVEEHLARLRRGAEVLGIPFSKVPGSLTEAVERALEANGLSEARVRITMTAGPGPSAPATPTEGPPTVLVTVSPLAPLAEAAFERGYGVVTSTLTRNSRSPLPRLKSTSFLESMLARREARDRGADEAIVLNERGCLAEASMANLFLVSGGRLMTPALDCGLLPGITRAAVIELARELAVPVEERWIEADELAQAKELFLTSSLIEVMPVTSVEGKQVGDGSPGAVTQTLAGAYRDLVARELAG